MRVIKALWSFYLIIIKCSPFWSSTGNQIWSLCFRTYSHKSSFVCKDEAQLLLTRSRLLKQTPFVLPFASWNHIWSPFPPYLTAKATFLWWSRFSALYPVNEFNSSAVHRGVGHIHLITGTDVENRVRSYARQDVKSCTISKNLMIWMNTQSLPNQFISSLATEVLPTR